MRLAPRQERARDDAAYQAEQALRRPRHVAGVDAASWAAERRGDLERAAAGLARVLTVQPEDRQVAALARQVDVALEAIREAERARLRTALARLDAQRDQLAAELGALTE